jgi:hypothetical protein
MKIWADAMQNQALKRPSTIVEPVAIVTRLVFSVPLYLLTCLGRYRTDLPSSAGQPFFYLSFFWAHSLI